VSLLARTSPAKYEPDNPVLNLNVNHRLAYLSHICRSELGTDAGT
jgi:hypothetical protein